MKKTIFGIFLVVILITSFIAPTYAVTPVESGYYVSVYKSIYDVNPVDLTLPKPLKVTLPNSQDFGVVVVDTKTKEAQAVETIENTRVNTPKAYFATATAVKGEPSNFVDGDPKTVAEFDIDQDEGSAEIQLSFDQELTSSALILELDDHVAPPYTTAIEAREGDRWVTVLAEEFTYDTYITFPAKTAKAWRVKFKHSQPLRIREITLQDDKLSVEKSGTEVFWLGKPGVTYQIYADAAVYKPVKTGELGNLLGNPDDIITATLGPKQTNQAYKDPDSDFDGIPNFRDNCVNLANEKQEDLDNNKRGDACEDHDKDGVIDAVDNCPQDPNANQQDTDGDKIGDVCDTEESRPTEKMPWLPWVGMGGAAIVVIGVIVATLKKDKK